jgi:transcriptional regulator with XRE-family HTH domain
MARARNFRNGRNHAAGRPVCALVPSQDGSSQVRQVTGTDRPAGDGSATGAGLRRLREVLGLSRAAMAEGMGLARDAYEALEADRRPLQPHHLRLAECLALDCAVERRDAGLVPDSLRRKVLVVAGLLTGREPSAPQDEPGARPASGGAPAAPHTVRAEDEERGQQTTDRRYNADD